MQECIREYLKSHRTISKQTKTTSSIVMRSPTKTTIPPSKRAFLKRDPPFIFIQTIILSTIAAPLCTHLRGTQRVYILVILRPERPYWPSNTHLVSHRWGLNLRDDPFHLIKMSLFSVIPVRKADCEQIIRDNEFILHICIVHLSHVNDWNKVWPLDWRTQQSILYITNKIYRRISNKECYLLLSKDVKLQY